jgi:hypothetical protein
MQSLVRIAACSSTIAPPLQHLKVADRDTDSQTSSKLYANFWRLWINLFSTPFCFNFTVQCSSALFSIPSRNIRLDSFSSSILCLACAATLAITTKRAKDDFWRKHWSRNSRPWWMNNDGMTFKLCIAIKKRRHYLLGLRIIIQSDIFSVRWTLLEINSPSEYNVLATDSIFCLCDC